MEKPRSVYFFGTCLIDMVFPQAGLAAMRLLRREGIEVIELLFDTHGREHGSTNPRHMRDVLRDVHRALTKEGARDLVTIIASGGIAQAEADGRQPDYAQCLHDAKRWVRSQDKWKSPYYWAPFVAIGPE